MSYDTNTLQIKTLESMTARAPQNVIGAIQQASSRSGVDFSYLVQQASAESSFNPTAKARTSSATGLYQFIDSTWLSMMDRYGEQYGLSTTGKSEQEILAMRNDPKAASFMAAAFASENERFLNNNWGGEVGATELYLAHFMGASGATSFLNARDENPFTPAADLFPRAARANHNVFYNRETGDARTVEEVYQFFDKKFQIKNNPESTHIAGAPLPPDMPDSRLAQTKYNALYHNDPRVNTDSIIMQKAQAMREASNAGQTNRINVQDLLAAHVPGSANTLDQPSIIRRNRSDQPVSPIARQDNRGPFFQHLSRPVDIMMLTQTVTPSKVIRDKA